MCGRSQRPSRRTRSSRVLELIAEHWDREPRDPLVQAASGAVVGVGMAAWSADRDLGRAAALGILRVGVQGLEEAFRP